MARAEPELVIDELSVDPDVAPDVLDLLAKEALGQSMRFWSLVCDRIGRGGPDHELLEIVGRRSSMVLSGPTNVVDAWLRLHEIGFEFPENRQYPDVATLLRSLDMSALAAIRPDLGARASRALADLDTVIPELEHGPATVVLRAIREDRWLPPNDPQARIHYKGGWQEQLRMLDTNLVNGGMSAEEYRHRREQLLAYATGRPQPPQI